MHKVTWFLLSFAAVVLASVASARPRRVEVTAGKRYRWKVLASPAPTAAERTALAAGASAIGVPLEFGKQTDKGLFFEYEMVAPTSVVYEPGTKLESFPGSPSEVILYSAKEL